ncbi:DNA/RNA helicase domain-containing protein [Pediococcus stilesii]|uniref:DNA/RNA helicase domain-containing protein n=1 Tax=Pediococcus stilesii TaxID=331679 RepID=UPI0026B31FCD
MKIFKSAKELYKAIEQKDLKKEEDGLSRILATYDWKYSSTKQKSGELYEVETDDFKLPWNLQVSKDNKKLSWVERKDSINEVGSTYTIQGFDLNYSGVIIGPSVKFRNGKIIYDPKYSSNKYAIQNRTISDGTKVKVFDKLLPNELNVLLTRGVNGLYIYAVDEELRKILLKAQNGEIK